MIVCVYCKTPPDGAAVCPCCGHTMDSSTMEWVEEQDNSPKDGEK